MPRHALSDTKKAQIRGKQQDELYSRAAALYLHEQSIPPPHHPLSLRAACEIVLAEFKKETKGKVKMTLSHTTLGRRINGGKTIREFNAEKEWLSFDEKEQLIAVLLELADWGHPCNYTRIRELVNEILRARLGDKFPKTGVGKEWPYRFVERESDRLHRYKARGLDDVRSQAVNETAHNAWCDLVEEIQLRGDDGEPIAPECTFAMDEAGFQPNGSEGYEYVIGPTGKKLQYQQRSGSRDNTTVCVTICANGTALRPLVLFSGKGFQEKWYQDNPAKASYVALLRDLPISRLTLCSLSHRLGYSKKGWTDNVIALEWLKDFDKQTRDIAAGRTRVLYIDGSHITFEFVQYARQNNIKVPKYIPHGTHVYQGLDVVCFSPVKLDFAQRRDALLRETGEHINKENFLSIYGATHLHVLTPALIKEAFRKTGIVPVDRTVFDPALLAPSKESSHQVATAVIPPTPVRLVTELILDVAPLAPINETDSPPDSPTPSGPGPHRKNTAIAQRSRIMVNELKGTSAGYLFGNSPIKSTHSPPDMPLETISPQKNTERQVYIQGLLGRKATTKFERLLKAALEEECARSQHWKTRTVYLQSTLVLQQLFCRRLRCQLKAKETKAGKRSNRKLKNPGLGRVITDDEFFNELKEQREAEEREAQRKVQRKSAEERYAEAVAAWKKGETDRAEENERRREECDLAKAQWKEEKEKAKKAGTKVKDWLVTHPQPKRSDPPYSIIPRPPKPTLQQFLDEEEEDWESVDENDDGSESDESETEEA
ncbi:hypothetical protein NMY22_g13623 [Coprinellus aureogranulatus]|nr:hypothetical protein NMY22_g13623 [Coprinellus aureogranulatus]